MRSCDCGKSGKDCCCIAAALFSFIISVIVGILYAIGLIPVAIIFILIALIVSVLSIVVLGGTLFSANLMERCNGFRKCLCKNKCLLISSIGTLILGTITTSVGIINISIISIVGVALTTFFFTWMVISLYSLLSCIIKETCKNRED